MNRGIDPGLLRLYEQELGYLREMGGEFARHFPKVAGRLGMDALEVADPYVERLLEGFAFMAARVQLQLEAEQPRFVQHLLESVYPNAIAPLPAMGVFRLQLDLADPALARGAVVPRGTALLANQARGQNTRCEFRTAHALRLWPVEVVNVQYLGHAGELPVAGVRALRDAAAGLRIRLRLHGGLRFDQLPMDSLSFHVAAPDDVAHRLHALIFGAGLGSWVSAPAGSVSTRPAAAGWCGPDSLRGQGYGDDEALLPVTARGFSGHRLVQELAALPQRFLFVEVTGLRERLARVGGTEADLHLAFSRDEPGLEARVPAQALALNCTPAINLFPKRLDRIQPRPSDWEHHVVPDRTRPLDFELHSLSRVVAHGTGRLADQLVAPLYAVTHDEATASEAAGPGGTPGAWYTLRRELRLPSRRQQEQGPRSSYLGCESWLSLVDARQQPVAEDVRQISLAGLVSNRDLPLLLGGAGSVAGAIPGSGAGAGSGHEPAPGWTLDLPGPVRGATCLRGPTPPRSRLPQGDIGWALVNQLAQNHLSIGGEDPVRAAAALRSQLLHLGSADDAGWHKQVEGLRAVRAQMVTRRLPMPGPLAYGRGVAIELEVDELAFQGGSAFLMGSVLEACLARQASLNSCTQTRLVSATRGLLMSWPPRVGSAAVI